MVAVGIDLGTTNSCVAIYGNNGVEVIANETGERTTPSYILFSGDVPVVGKAAKAAGPKNSANIIYDAKRVIGKSYSDSALQNDINNLNWPFKVKSDVDDRPLLHAGRESLLAEKASAYVLKTMKNIVEVHHLGNGKVMDQAVITVPAYFNDSQREATKAAAELAGLKVLKLLPEPSAAGLAFCYQKMRENMAKEKTLLVYDLGGGTFDVSIMKIVNGQVENIAIKGDTHLGGSDFDARLMDFCIKKFKIETGEDIRNEERPLWRLRTECIKAKEHLSTFKEFNAEIPSLHNNEDFEYKILRSDFEKACEDLFAKTMVIVDDAMKDAKMSPKDIDHVLLVGGSSRIPKVQELLSKKFGEHKLDKTANPDEAVAYGAAIQAAIITGEIEKQCNIVLMEITPLSIGIKLRINCNCNYNCDCQRYNSVIIPRNTKIPTEKSHISYTAYDNQDSVSITMLEGEHYEAEKNNVLGECNITGIPLQKKGQEMCLVCKLDANGMLHISAKIADKQAEMTINYNKKRLNTDEIHEMLKNIKI